ncbi:hypothetical protein INT47_012934, partial [Mucor saturninus]
MKQDPSPELMSTAAEQQEFTEKDLRNFEVEERVQARLPAEHIKTYQAIRTVKNIPQEFRLKTTPKREEFWSKQAEEIASNLLKRMSTSDGNSEMVKMMAEAFKQAMQTQKATPKPTLKQPDCYFGERSASILDGWLYSVERYASYYGMSSEDKCSYAVNLLRRQASTWWQRLEMQDRCPKEWEAFKSRISAQFRPSHTQLSARDRLASLLQTTSVETYVNLFRDIQLEIPTMNEDEAQDRFIRGLQPDIRFHVITLQPLDLDDAVRMALAYESGRQTGFHGMYAERPVAQQYYQSNDVVPMDLDAVDGRRGFHQNRSSSNRQYNNRPAQTRSEVTCHWCEKRGHIRRNCRERIEAIRKLDEQHGRKKDFRQTQLNLTEPSDMINKEPVLPYVVVPPKTLVSVPNEEDCEFALDRRFLEELNAAIDTDLPLYMATHNGQSISVLIDSGASANYVSPRITDQIKNVERISGRPVETAGGHLTTINQKASLLLSLNGYQDTIDAYVFPTKFDLILGRTWLQKAKPVPDWQHDRWHLQQNGQEFVLSPQNTRPVQPQLHYVISAKQTQKLIKKNEAACYLVHFKGQPGEQSPDDKWNGLVKEFDDVFLEGLPGLPPDRDVQHVINTGEAEPTSKPPFKMSPRELDELKKQLKELLDLGLIRPSSSPWGAPILFVKKKDGAMRMCVDYRALNKVTIRNNHPLPRIDECLERLRGSNHFTSLDLKSGYHQVRIQPSDVPKTAFNTRYGQYEFLVLPFGLTNAPPTFQHLMNNVLGDCLDEFALVYLDDILIFSKTPEDHEKHVRHVLNRLREAKLVANLKKCEFNKQELVFLGFHVSALGILPSPDKVKAVQNWIAPTNVQEVRQFIGLAQHYRRFIPGFAGIAAPLTDLTRGVGPKRRSIVWTDECQASFELLKEKLTSAPVLLAPDMDKPFRVETDASDFGVGAVLLQQDETGTWKPLAFESKKLSKAERSYPAQERELLGILHALRSWRCLIEGKPFTVFTDHLPLKYFRSQVKPTPRLVRWISELELYDPTIEYKPGKDNNVPDVLSRIGGPESEDMAAESMEPDYLYVSQIPDESDWPKLYTHPEEEWPEDYKELLQRQRSRFVIHDQKVFRRVKFGDGFREIRYALFARRANLVDNFHKGFGHAGETTVYDLIRKRWWWPGMRTDIQDWLTKCPQCQLASNAERNIHHAPMKPLDVPPAFSRWHLDFIGELPTTINGNRWILVAVDYATNWPIARAVPDATGEAIAKFLYEEIVMRFGCPDEILTDRGANFMSKILLHYTDQIKVHHKFTSAFHPRTNGKCERLNGILKQMLRKYVHGAIHRWDEYLDTALLACRIRKHRTTGFSPFFLTYGREPRLPGDPLRPFMSADLPDDPQVLATDALTYLRNLRKAREEAESRVRTNSLQDKERWDAIMKPHSFAIGAHVLMRHENKFGLEYNWMGPYLVIDKNPDTDVYKLTTVEGIPYTSWVHADRLKLAKVDVISQTWFHPTASRAQTRRDLLAAASSPLDVSVIDDSLVARGRSTVWGGDDVVPELMSANQDDNYTEFSFENDDRIDSLLLSEDLEDISYNK